MNRLGKREPEIYGEQTFDQYLSQLREMYTDHKIDYFQSNHEGEIIDSIHRWGDIEDGIIINPGGLTHTSVALRDAIASVSAPFVEVHISNIYSREQFRHHSYVSAVCRGCIAGLGLSGYEYALKSLLKG